MPFDPNQPFDPVTKPDFDPSKPFDSVQNSAPSKPAFDPSEPFHATTPQDHIKALTNDPAFDPAAYAAQTGDTETAFQARQALRNRSIGEKAGVIGDVLATPSTYTNALTGAAKFVGGLVATPLHTLGQAAATVPTFAADHPIVSNILSPIVGAAGSVANAIGGDSMRNALENEQQTQGAEVTLAAQQVEEGLRHTGRAVQNFTEEHPILSRIAAPGLGVIPSDYQAPDEQTERGHFADEIQAYRNAQQLAQQRPLDTGAVATAAKAATGTPNLADVYSPEAIAAQGARPVSPLLTESMAAASDPTNLLIPLAGEIPGLKTIAGGIVQGAGRALQIPSDIMGAIPKLAKIAKIPEGATTLAEGVSLGHLAYVHPAAAAMAAGAVVLGKLMGWAGRGIEAQGAALRTGIPSALDQTAQTALSAGESAIGTNIQRAMGNTANSVVSTALGFAPVNAALSGGDPRQFAESEIGAGVMGGLFGLAGDRARLEQVAHYRLAEHGAQQFTENPAYPAHQATMQRFSPQDQANINALRSVMFAGTGTDVLVVDGNTFAQQAGSTGGDARGAFIPSPDGHTIYLNADAIGRGAKPGEVASKSTNTAGHEAGHAVVKFLTDASRESTAQGMFSTIAGAMTPEQVHDLTESYVGALLKSTPVAPGQDRAAVEAQIRADNPPEKIIEENLAEITRRILSGRSIASFALPQPTLEKLTNAAAAKLEQWGFSPKIDPNASLLFKAQMVKEAARRMNVVLYEAGAKASAAAKEGPGLTQKIIEARKALAEIPTVTPGMSAVRANAIARQRAAAEKELAKWENIASGAPETEPAEPGTAPEKTAREVVADELKQDGIKNPHPLINAALARNPKLTESDQLLKYVRDMQAEKVAAEQAKKILTSNADKYTPTEANRFVSAVIEQHQEPVTDVQKLVRAARRVKAGGKVAPGEFNRPEKPAVRVGVTFNDHQDQTHTVTGEQQRPARRGDFILTRDGQIRRVTKPTPDGNGVETVGTFVGDETRSSPVPNGTFAVLETAAKPKASPAPIQPNAQEQKPAPSIVATPPQPVSGQPQAPTETTPTLRIIPHVTKEGNPTGRFQIVDAAGNPTSKTTFGSERDAQQSIDRQGKGRFNLPPPIKDGEGNPVHDILDAIREGGIYLGNLSPEERQRFIQAGNQDEGEDRYLRNLLSTDNKDRTPDEVARLLHTDGFGSGTMSELPDLITEAYKARKLAQERGNSPEQSPEEKDAEAKFNSLPQTIQEKFTRPGGANWTPEEIRIVKAVFPDWEPEHHEPSSNEQTPSAPDESLPTERGGNVISAPGSPEETPSVPLPKSPDVGDFDRIAAQARETFLSDKTPAKAGKNKGNHTQENQKKADKAAFDAAADAHAATVPLNYEGMRLRIDGFGKRTVSGTVDPSRPFDQWLIQRARESGHMPGKSLDNLLALQNAVGKTVSYDYGHAPVSYEGDMPTKTGRETQQTEHTVAKRLAGESPQQVTRKNSVPLRVGFNPGTDSFTVYGVSQEKLLNNFNHLTEKMGDLEMPLPFRDINDPRFVAAFKNVIANHENGWKGDGSAPAVPTHDFPFTPNPDWAQAPEHQLVPKDQFEFINALLGDESMKSGSPEAKAKAHLANENEMAYDPTGEANELRYRINSATPPVDGKTWSKATIEDPLNENISPALVSDIGPANQDDESIRQHGKVGDLGRFFDKGKTPNRAFTAAAFMPDIPNDEIEIDGNKVTTGTPIELRYFRNNESATKLHGQPDRDSPFDRGHEPSGRYMTQLEGEGILGKQYEKGTVRFKNPIVIPSGEYGEPSSWKRTISEAFGGKTGKQLSKAIIDAGHDGVITTNQDRAGNKYTGEILDLTTFDSKKAKYMPDEETRKTPQERARDRIDSRFIPAETGKSPTLDESDPAWIQRFEQLSQKEYRGNLTAKEQDEIDGLQQRLVKQFGSLNAYEKARNAEGKTDIHETLRDEMRKTPQERARERIQQRWSFMPSENEDERDDSKSGQPSPSGQMAREFSARRTLLGPLGRQSERTEILEKGKPVALANLQGGDFYFRAGEKDSRWAIFDSKSGSLISKGKGEYEPDPALISDWLSAAKYFSGIKSPSAGTVFIRFGNAPKDGRSTNHVTGHKENGISVYGAEWNPFTGVFDLKDADHAGTAIFHIAAGVQPYIVRGTTIGTGSDGEPIITGMRKVFRVKFDLKNKGYVQQGNPENIASHGEASGREQTEPMAKTPQQRAQERINARFMPETPERFTPSTEDRNTPVEVEAPYLQRFTSLMHKDDTGKLTPAEDDELDALHKRVDSEYPGGFKAFQKRFEQRSDGSPSFMPEGESSPQQKAKIRQRDNEYFKTVNSGNMEDAQKLTDEAAKEAGYTVRAFHGTPHGDITTFDHTKSPSHYPERWEDDTHGSYHPKVAGWFSTDERVADSYAAGLFKHGAGEWDQGKYKHFQDEDLPDGTTIRVISNGSGKTLTPEQVSSDEIPESNRTPKGKLKKNSQIQVILPNGQSIWNLGLDFSTPQSALKSARTMYNSPIPQRTSSRTMQVYLRMKNPKTIDLNGGQFYKMGDKAGKALSEGYDGLIVKNVRDPGSNPERLPISDSIAVFDPASIKSADPITRDSDGEIIPLSERFKPENSDIRFMPDTGNPEEGNTPGERLAREAEQAGVVLNVSTLKGLIQEDEETMNRVRSRIQQNTGKPARFLATDPTGAQRRPTPQGSSPARAVLSKGANPSQEDERKRRKGQTDFRAKAKERIRERELAAA